MVVASAVALAAAFGMSEKIIALTIIATGTSLPELITSITAILKKKDDLAIGTIIGSNIFNVLMILGVSALVNPIAYSPLFNTDMYVLFGGAVFLLAAMATGKKNKLDRWKGAMLLAAYIAYVIYLILQ
jgi:cation:H+ antiporter